LKILITGGTGFIGLHLAKSLLAQGKKVVIADNQFRGKVDEETKEVLDNKNVEYLQLDLTKPADVEKLGEGYDHVYHFAAINGTKHFYDIPHEVLRVNTLTCLNILEWFKEGKGKKILFSSSSETYAGSINKGIAEVPTKEDVALCIEDTQNPRWSYGGSKIAGELLFINYARQYKFPMSIVRFHNIYGERMGFEHVMPEFSKRIVEGEFPLKIYGGTETRAFCYIGDTIKAVQMVMESDKTNGETINIGNDKEEISIQDLGKKMLKIAGKEPAIEILEAPKGSAKRRCPDITKIRELVGFEPEVSLDEGTKKLFAWYKNHFEKK